MTELVLAFETEEDREYFLGWFLDGGGEYKHNDARESAGMPTLESVTMRNGTPPAEDEPDLRRIYAIELRPYPEEP